MAFLKEKYQLNYDGKVQEPTMLQYQDERDTINVLNSKHFLVFFDARPKRLTASVGVYLGAGGEATHRVRTLRSDGTSEHDRMRSANSRNAEELHWGQTSMGDVRLQRVPSHITYSFVLSRCTVTSWPTSAQPLALPTWKRSPLKSMEAVGATATRRRRATPMRGGCDQA